MRFTEKKIAKNNSTNCNSLFIELFNVKIKRQCKNNNNSKLKGKKFKGGQGWKILITIKQQINIKVHSRERFSPC